MSKKKKKTAQTQKPAGVRPVSKADAGIAHPRTGAIDHVNGIYLMLFLILLVQLFVFKDYIFQKKLYLFLDIGSDSYNLYYPGFLESARQIRTHWISTWSFSDGMGGAVFPGGLSNPFGLILSVLGPHRLAYGIIYVELLKMLLTGIFFYLYLKVAHFSKYVSIVGGVLASFIGYLVLGSSGWYAHSTNVVYFVFFLYAFELFYQKKQPVLFPVAVFFVATEPFRLYMYSVFLFTYALLKLFSDKKFNIKASVVFLVKLAGLGAIGVGMSAVFSLEPLLSKINSPRVSGTVAATGKLLSLPIFGLPNRLEWVTMLMRFFSNDLMGAGSFFKGCKNYLEAPIFYSGLLPLLLAPQVILFKEKRKKIAFAMFFFAWMIPLAFPFFRFALYAFMGDYYKHGLSMFVPAIMLIYGLNGLEIIVRKHRINFVVLFATLGILLAILYLPYFDGTPFAGQNMIDKNLRMLVSCFLIAYAGILCFLRFDNAGYYVKSMLLLLVCVELGWFSSITVNDRTALTAEQFAGKIGYNDYTVDAIHYLKSIDSGFYRINKDFSSSLAEVNSINDAEAQGYYGTPSYSSFNNKEYIQFLETTEIIPKGQEKKTRWSLGLLKRPFLQAIASVKYNLVKNEDYAHRDIFFKTIYEYVARFGDVTVLKNRFSLPLGFTYDRCMLLKDYEELSKTQKDMAMFSAVVTNRPLPPLTCVGKDEMVKTLKDYKLSDFTRMVDQKRAQALKVTSFAENRITGDIALTDTRLLFFSIPIDDGWHAFDNGRPVHMIKANIGFTGILLDHGNHHIELKYIVKYIRTTLSVTIISLIIFLVLVFRKKMHHVVAQH